MLKSVSRRLDKQADTKLHIRINYSATQDKELQSEGSCTNRTGQEGTTSHRDAYEEY
jgi:hypothetical protein